MVAPCAVLLMFPIIIGPDSHLPFPLFWESTHSFGTISVTSVSQPNSAPALITTLSDEKKKQTSGISRFDLQREMT